MKTVTLTPCEFHSFRQLATFFFDMYVKSGFVFITADADQLEKLGY
jgi:hypothetical protein